MITVGIAMLVLGVLLLSVAAIVGGALSLSAPSCGSSPCETPDIAGWFTWAGVPFLTLGVALLGLGLWWTFR